MFTIAGSGFGLYGYLPALIETFDEPVILPRAYEAKVRARPELRHCLSSVRWVEDAKAAMSQASGAVLAKPPEVQERLIEDALGRAAIGKLVLEKPVAVTPAVAANLTESLEQSGKRFRVAYTFLHTAWAERLAWPASAGFDGHIAITWTFMAHHFRNALSTWKREHSRGGGVLRFFGIHLLALLAGRGYRTVERSVLDGAESGQPERWSAVFSGPSLPRCHVEVDSRCTADRFGVASIATHGTAWLVDLQDPFQLESPPGVQGADRRIGVLTRLLETFGHDDLTSYGLYDEVNRLWKEVEMASRYESDAC